MHMGQTSQQICHESAAALWELPAGPAARSLPQMQHFYAAKQCTEPVACRASSCTITAGAVGARPTPAQALSGADSGEAQLTGGPPAAPSQQLLAASWGLARPAAPQPPHAPQRLSAAPTAAPPATSTGVLLLSHAASVCGAIVTRARSMLDGCTRGCHCSECASRRPLTTAKTSPKGVGQSACTAVPQQAQGQACGCTWCPWQDQRCAHPEAPVAWLQAVL